MAQETLLDLYFASQDSLQIISPSDISSQDAFFKLRCLLDSWAAAAQVLFLSTIIVQVGRYLVILVATVLKDTDRHYQPQII